MITEQDLAGMQSIKNPTVFGHVWINPPSIDIQEAMTKEFVEHGGIVLKEGLWATSAKRIQAARVTTEISDAPTRLEARLIELEKKINVAIDIGLENRTILRQLQETVDQDQQNGLGAIHSLNGGRVQLKYPFVYYLQALDGEVVAGIDELSAYGVGASECDAVAELQEELWDMFEELEKTPADELGSPLTETLRTLRARIRPNAVDA